MSILRAKRFLAAGLLAASGAALCFVSAISAPIPEIKPDATAAVREEHVVTIDSKPERWRLEWVTPPKPVCSPEEECWQCCPCSGFAFGEYGKLDLVRTRVGATDDRLSLGPLFRETEHPTDVPDVAVLRRWPVLEKDYEAPESPDLPAAVRARPIAEVMKIADYDHDGRASEFPFQIGASPCGHQQTVLIGISHSDSTLHVFGTVDHPKQPLVLDCAGDWDRVLHSSGAVTLTELKCGDHGSEEEIVLRLHATPRGITAVRSIYSCGSNFKRGRLVSTEAF
ncbi:MAG: hypothetical protein QOI04_1646 [Verrucomicrobiota bacterium]|jgi:hypothetical protein